MSINKSLPLVKVSATTFIDAIGSGVLTFSLGLLLLKYTGLAISFGFSIIIGPLVSLIMAPIIGNLIDSLPHKTVALIGGLGMLISIVCFAGYYEVYFSSKNIFLAVILFNMASNSFSRMFSMSYLSSVGGIVPKTKMQRLNGIISLSSSMSGIVSAPIAGVLFPVVNFRYLIFLRLLTSVVVLFLTMVTNFEKYNSFPENQGNVKEKGSFKAALNYLRSKSQLLKITISVCLLNFASVLFEIGTPFVVLKRLHLSSSISGLVQSCSSMGVIAGGLIISIITVSRPFKFTVILYEVYSLLSLAVGIFLNINLIPAIIILALFNLIAGSITSMADAPIFTYIQKTVPKKIMGHLMTLLFTTVQILQPLGVLFYSTLLDKFNFKLIFLVNGITLFCFIIYFFILSSKSNVGSMKEI
ncbi:MFS transporter [Levilactobacillus namurensis]|uniref:MFS transporter n=1 Tax=Levilactobacillus namurensis TaxID=380393 RepID=UPI0022305A1B|nr:MFS transporter [Levilactobacillus namurensis]MCW3778703.1 MFS transporter [Levilactobacillus namurensis]MDT7019643.1 MFS transporter [Levilactobacillus namurensis]WNN65764.1 MFS transporter [Levilactobacillus namurensis]